MGRKKSKADKTLTAQAAKAARNKGQGTTLPTNTPANCPGCGNNGGKWTKQKGKDVRCKRCSKLVARKK